VTKNPLTGVPYSKRFFELLHKRRGLPAWETRDEWLRLTKRSQVTIISGEPGSGKTTQIPQILLDAGYHVHNGGSFRSLAVCQPYKTSTISAAQRVSEELDVPMGSFVGYTVKFEDKTSEQTLLRFMSDDMLLHEFLADPLLSKFSVIMVDEVHERTMSSDVILGLLKLLLVTRPELKVILTSAKLQMPKLQRYFDAPIVVMTARIFPVDIHYLSEPEKDYDYVKAAIRTVMQIHTEEPAGDILVFLTSEEEIEFVCRQLLKVAKEREYADAGEMQIVPLHGDILPEQLSRVFAPAGLKPGAIRPARKVIASTHIGETSMPIDSVMYVVDPGFGRHKEYNPRSRCESYLVSPISKERALRRAARATRRAHGKCYRLFTKHGVQEELRPQDHPEMLRSDLCSVVLALKRVGVESLVHFDFLDPPPPESLMRAIEILHNLGCLDDVANLTEIGEAVLRFPLHPQLARMLLESPKHCCSNEALSIVAMLTLPQVFVRPEHSSKASTDAKTRFAHLDGDHLTLLNIFHAYKQNVQDGVGPARFCCENFLNTRCMMSAENIRDQLKKIMEDLGLQMVSTDFKNPEYYPNIRRCILSGFFMQVARLEKKDEKTGQYFTIRERQECLLHHSTALVQKPEWVVYHEHVLTSKSFLKVVTQIRGEWLLDIAPHYYDPAKLPECEAKSLLEKMMMTRRGAGV
jgi:pre-mRNA-splicing factor ATP-dependent RNA helicase DHX15/PRP43